MDLHRGSFYVGQGLLRRRLQQAFSRLLGIQDYLPGLSHTYGTGLLSRGIELIGSRNFVRGAMLLAGAAMLSKFLGSIYTIVLQNIIGDHGMGLFQMAYPIYATLLAVATAGFPVAISKLVAEEVADGNPAAAKQVLRVAAWLLSLGASSPFSCSICSLRNGPSSQATRRVYPPFEPSHRHF
ncbi:oligosaccharide flippase family protein [Alicyclobacillus fastidiosus]|uniref:oligosaccharide flippase family protein n=1 Tax=Alicyclobacillus fastidiosus TaxID=392011 RepID=UPI0023E9CED2|nr:oligosaccharide flippase family protein [Alicyclobacillus fastidiosus]GMA64002.1 hypothetical protein GCM10025859_44420 [Alicyclobacillus fastidiosus]